MRPFSVLDARHDDNAARPLPPIERAASAVTAFVGRTLKGPVNEPVPIGSFAEFQLQFGGLWQPSTLSYAIEQFFESGGRSAIVVRVVNGGRAPSITLPAQGGVLRLRGRCPGTREYLRASVDYDGIAAHEGERFNLVLQRVRAPGSEQIEDQEIFRRVSVREGAERCVATLLAESRLVRLEGDLPVARPERTPGRAAGVPVGYVACDADGDDGDTLSDYDLIGDAGTRTGLFALEGVPQFNLLCIPPRGRDLDVGMTTWTIAARLCRRHQAMLIVDPPASWVSTDTALWALRDWPLHSEDALMYFPRVLAQDRLRGRPEVFAPGAAAAGMIARSDEIWPVWAAAEGEEAMLRPGLRAAIAVSETDRARLAHHGVNVLQSGRAPARLGLAPRTLIEEARTASDWRFLSARRFALFITTSLLDGTRWVLFERNRPWLWARARAQVGEFLGGLEREGAFVGRSTAESFFVICDERLNDATDQARNRFRLLFGFAGARPGEFHAFLLTHQPGASRVRPVSVNRLATSGARVEEEIEAAILRGLNLEA
ncbi:MAG: phage tail sheath family protein [Gammaproteobacteria bacterium]|nr:phage tail sheath family protein [Gammaproteobacteria bacterium]